MSAADGSRVLAELRPFITAFPGIDVSIHPAKGFRPYLPPLAPVVPPAGVTAESVLIPASSGAEVPLRVLVVRPEGTEALPVVLAFHGGGAVSGSPEAEVEMLYAFAQAGLVALSVDYRLAPEDPYPAAFEDAERAWEFVTSSSGLPNVIHDKAALYGSSAGSWIAEGLTFRLRGTSKTQPKLVLLDCALLDDRAIYPSQALDHPERSLHLWSGRNQRDVKQWIYGALDAVPLEAAPLRSTSKADLVGLPPHYLASCEVDSLAEQGPTYAPLLEEAGVEVQLKIWKSSYHAFHSLQPGSEIAKEAQAEYCTALKAKLA